MVYKYFRINCISRVLLISVTITLFVYLLLQTNMYASTTITGFLAIYQVYLLIRYIDKTNRDLTRFLESIKYSDFSQSFTTRYRDSSFAELSSAFNSVMQKFQRIRMEKEEHFRYLQTIVQHVGIGLIAFNQDGKVELINNAAKRILRIHRLKSIIQLESKSKKLTDILLHINPGEKQLVKLNDSEGLVQLSIHASGFTLHQQSYKLVSLQNIQSELEEKEIEAWQNLIRVLTHEIMNSIAPISSLASTADSLLTANYSDLKLDSGDETLDDISKAIKTIQKRSQGLLDFVDNYRKLTRIPVPDFEMVQVKELLERTKSLMTDQLENNSIDLSIEVDPESLQITADASLIEQVLINLCKNSVEAVRNTMNPVIKFIGMTDETGNPVIKIIDNGCGMKAEVIEKIFIPFFTTKKEGSGIGLSLSREIMRLHKGTLNVSSKPNEETVFIMRF